jgi:type IV pilus assembly protein PilE
MEVMIACVIVGILAAIATSSYNDQMNASRRSDGQTALMNMAAYMESYYTENNTYTGATIANLGLTNLSQQGYYTLSISTLAATSFTLTATPVAGGAQAGDANCPTLTLTNTNAKGPTLTCWGN